MRMTLCYTIKDIKKLVMLIMKKLLPRQKKWQIARSKKEIRYRKRRNKLKNKEHIKVKKKKASILNEEKIVAPKILSVFSNPKETLGFFKEVNLKIKRARVAGKLFFDLSCIEDVTVDAIMYLIAIIKNFKRINALRITCGGNLPKNDIAKERFENCGFYKYVNPQYSIKKSICADHINIESGIKADPKLASEICVFVHNHSSLKIINTKSLYTMMMELMTNTKQHAYNKNTYLNANWYIFVEDYPEYLQFVFLDTGDGIPNTVKRKNFFENIKGMFDLDDAFFISSALKGEFRSETNLGYRGKGLPEIYNRVKSEYILDFSVISGRGKCDVTKDGEIINSNLEENFLGTMLCWKLRKENRGE